MKKILMICVAGTMVFISYSAENNSPEVDKAVEESITKDYDQDGKYSSYEKALRRAQESVYVTLPEKRGNWYSVLEQIKEEEKELMPDEEARMRRKR
jgi:hypothetical protein